jgi:predicted polyphosphate/ATP-dependent NAD kinase
LPRSCTVGVVANPASGRDIRRLVSGASVFDNAEKGSMVHRLMAGLGSTGVERILMMPAGSGLSGSLERRLLTHRHDGDLPLPALEWLDLPATETALDTERAVAALCAAGVEAIVVLGGDGTHRLVAKGCGEMPICGLSTGTNNAFPELREATVAGLAVGLLATGQVEPDEVLRRQKTLRVRIGGREDIALVDVAATRRRFVGARALWRVSDVARIFVTFAAPHAVGLSAIAGQLVPTTREAPTGVVLDVGERSDPECSPVTVAIAPGLLAIVPVARVAVLEPGVPHDAGLEEGSLALDGERELEFGPGDAVEVRLDVDGPRMLDVQAALAAAARDGLLNGKRTRRKGA